MTAVQSSYQAAGVPDPLVRFYHVGCALGVCEASIKTMFQKGRLPKPDVGGAKKASQWRLSTLRKANPPLAESVEILLKLPIIAAA
jgi:hypothetical protein